ncbi:hypothetical protein [Actinomadura chokoriensis]|uniref:Uncharacterized protein n=1 Tax=Actinomadura chokoriensis TaxID=454156 RepID=A0ABV4R0Z5_9ACTN
MREDQEVPVDGGLTAPLLLPEDRPGEDEPAEVAVQRDRIAITEVDPAPVRAFGADVERLAGLVKQLAALAAVLGDRLDGEVRDALDGAERALAEARGARQESADADQRAEQAAARAEAALRETAQAREEFEKGLAAAKASVTAAQESEANAWKEAGAHQQARATSANEAAHAEGLRKRAEAAWSTEHQARDDAERERDELATRLSAEQSALAIARTDLADVRAELAEARSKLEAAADTERRLRAELSVVQGEVAGLTVERNAAAGRAEDQAVRAKRAEQLADSAEDRILAAMTRADRAEQRADAAEERADAAEVRIDRDAATVRALQETLRAALDLPAVEELDDGQGVRVGESAAVTARLGGLIGVDQVPDVMDGELAGRFARAILAVRVHQATKRPASTDLVDQPEDDPADD